MNLNRIISKLCIALAALGLHAAAAGQAVEQALAEEFPPQSITTVERANAALKQVPDVRADIAARTLDEKSECYQRFFTASCLNDALDRERKAKKIVRRVEVEANAWLRREKAAERDRAIAEREQRAEQQRAKAITITGATRDAGSADTQAAPKPEPGTDDARR